MQNYYLVCDLLELNFFSFLFIKIKKKVHFRFLKYTNLFFFFCVEKNEFCKSSQKIFKKRKHFRTSLQTRLKLSSLKREKRTKRTNWKLPSAKLPFSSFSGARQAPFHELPNTIFILVTFQLCILSMVAQRFLCVRVLF